jgi:signal transduction histidine kinase
MKRRIRLRTLLLLINLGLLTLPLAGIWLLRLYESALIRQTEVELVAQGAALAGGYRVERHRLLATGGFTPEGGAPAPMPEPARPPGLDLADDPVLPAPPDTLPVDGPPASLSAATGAALAPVLRDTQAVTLAALRITDPRGTIVSTTGDDLGRGLAALDEVTRALAGEPVDVLRNRDQPARDGPLRRGADLRVFVAMPIVDDGRVVAAILLSRTPRDLAQAIYGKRAALLAMAGLTIGLGALVALLVSRFVTRPLDVVVAQARRVAAGEIGAARPLTGRAPREAVELSEAVARMAATLEHRADYIRSFAAHVSHEFKTPLAGAKGAVDERAHFLAVVAGGLDRLDRLVRRLLDLARADMIRPDPVPPAALAPMLDRIARRYPAVPIEIAADRVQVAVPAELLDILIGNLIDNAIQHAGRPVQIAITATRAPDRVELTVADDGPGIAPGDTDRIFDAFFTTARATGGTGLGLSIVRAIVTGLGGSIELRPGPGARFRLTLPGA